MRGTAIDGMFSSFVQLVGHGNSALSIPGMLKVADVEHLVRAAGEDRVLLNNMDRSEWSGALQSSYRPAVEFFEQWLRADSN